MYAAKELWAVLLLTTTVSFVTGDSINVRTTLGSSDDWLSYIASYPGKSDAPYPKYYYNYNKKLITSHNLKADRDPQRITYTLGINQFTDMRLIHFSALFPKTTPPTTTSTATDPPAVQAASPTFDFITDLQLSIVVEDQGTVCNSGWAYATAKAVEVYAANELLPTARLSAQNLIDCAGAGIGCTRQVAQTAFEYLVRYQQPLHTQTDYPNNNRLTTQAMCTPPTNPSGTLVTVASYSQINNPDDNTILQYLSAQYPVVIEYDPTSFDFMHYKSGIFQQPHTKGGSHYMTVIGYGTDTNTGLNYWLVLNSFGTTWGENGFIRILRDPSKPLTRVALFPTGFAP